MEFGVKLGWVDFEFDGIGFWILGEVILSIFLGFIVGDDLVVY